MPPQDRVTQLGFNATSSACPHGVVRGALALRVRQAEAQSSFCQLTIGVLLDRPPIPSKRQLPLPLCHAW